MKIFMRCLHISTWLTQRATLGAQMVLLEDQQVLLVKHVYKSGWHLPGGGINPPEEPWAAAARELMEETGYRVTSSPELLIFVSNRTSATKRDYVAIFFSSNFQSPIAGYRQSREIKELKWFPLRNLPEDTDGLTRRAVEQIILNELT